MFSVLEREKRGGQGEVRFACDQLPGSQSSTLFACAEDSALCINLCLLGVVSGSRDQVSGEGRKQFPRLLVDSGLLTRAFQTFADLEISKL